MQRGKKGAANEEVLPTSWQADDDVMQFREMITMFLSEREVDFYLYKLLYNDNNNNNNNNLYSINHSYSVQLSQSFTLQSKVDQKRINQDARLTLIHSPSCSLVTVQCIPTASLPAKSSLAWIKLWGSRDHIDYRIRITHPSQLHSTIST